MLIGVVERAGSGLHSIHYVWENIGFEKPLLKEFFTPDRVFFEIAWDKIKNSSEKPQKSSEKT